MAKLTIHFTDWQGTQRAVDVDEGTTIMEAATFNDVPGIDGDCGGACACATCHVYVDPAWTDKIPAKEEMEASMLTAAFDIRPNSRLGCQIRLTKALDGIKVETPKTQF